MSRIKIYDENLQKWVYADIGTGITLDGTLSKPTDAAPAGVVGQQIKNLQNYINNKTDNLQNSFKYRIIGNKIDINDISPIKHKINCKVVSKNLLDPKEKNEYQNMQTFFENNGFLLKKGETVILSSDASIDNMYFKEYNIQKILKRSENSDFLIYTANKDIYIYVQVENNKGVSNINFQLEYGNIRTVYSQYVNDVTTIEVIQVNDDGNQVFYANEDGVIEDMFSTYPEMHVSTTNKNVLILLDYNVDSNLSNISIIKTNNPIETLLPNKMYIWGEIEQLEIKLGQDFTSIPSEYMFQFTSGNEATNLILPENIKWLNTPVIESNKIYQFSILNNLGVCYGA